MLNVLIIIMEIVVHLHNQAQNTSWKSIPAQDSLWPVSHYGIRCGVARFLPLYT